jgi:hypothetical protein
MQKSLIDEIKELKAQLESKTEQAKAEALEKASEAISFLRILGFDNDTILKELGFRGRAKNKESREGAAPKDETCPICHFRTDPPHDGRPAGWRACGATGMGSAVARCLADEHMAKSAYDFKEQKNGSPSAADPSTSHYRRSHVLLLQQFVKVCDGTYKTVFERCAGRPI